MLKQLAPRPASADHAAAQVAGNPGLRRSRPSLDGRQFVSTTAPAIDNASARERTPVFFKKLCAASALLPAQQASLLTGLSRTLSQLDRGGRVGGFRLLAGMSASLPAEQRAQVLAALAKRLSCLPATERRAGFTTLLASAATLPPAAAARVLPALARSLRAGGNDNAGFVTLHAQSAVLDADAQARVLPGLIRQIGVLPMAQRKAAFDTIAAQLPSLPARHCSNGLKGLAGKVRKLAQHDQATAFGKLGVICAGLPVAQRGTVQLQLQAIAA